MASRPAGGLLLLCLYLGVTVSVPSSDLVKSWGGSVTVTRVVTRHGLYGWATV